MSESMKKYTDYLEELSDEDLEHEYGSILANIYSLFFFVHSVDTEIDNHVSTIKELMMKYEAAIYAKSYRELKNILTGVYNDMMLNMSINPNNATEQ